MDLVMELTGCSPVEATNALKEHKEIWLAVDSLMAKPVVTGEKYIPKKPVIDTGLTQEQQERCDRGRWLQDQVNAVFSVAHSKTLPAQPVLEELSPEEAERLEKQTTSEVQSPLTTSSRLGSDEKTLQ